MINPKIIRIIAMIIAATVTGCSGLSSQSTSIPSHMVTEVSPVTLPTETPTTTAQIGLPNPASVYCEEQGGSVEIRTDDTGGQYGVCIFQDGSECDEWAFFRGECKSDAHVYINDDYGFSISAPAPWTFEEHPDYLILNKPGYRFFLGFQRAGEEPKPFRTGMPEGDFVDDGNATLLGQAIPKRILVFEGKNKVVAYGGRIKAGELILVMYLDGVESADTNYQAIDISPEVMAEADQIITSFTLKSGDQPILEFNP